MKQEVLRLERITDTGGGVTTLNNFSLHIFAGEIMGLIFVDAQGKKELVDLICKNKPLHYGMVYFRETLVNSYKLSSMTANPVTVIEKESRLIGTMTVAENVFVLRRGFKKQLIHPKTLNEQFAVFAREVGINIGGGELVKNLSPYEKCVVQLLKAVMVGHRLVIIQDISNAVSAADLVKFHALLHRFSVQGIAFLYICNHHEEAFTVCDRAAIVRNGQVARVVRKEDFNDKIFEEYRFTTDAFSAPEEKEQAGAAVLRFESVVAGGLHGLSFSLARGECVALLDVNNAALGDIFSLLAYKKRPEAGRILLEGKPYKKIRNSSQIGLIQELPTQSMLYQGFSYLDNLCFLAGERQPRLWLHSRMKRSIRHEYRPMIGEDIDALHLKNLSATSLYNLIYYGQHLYNPKVLVIMQPFFGADMYLRRHILGLIDSIRSRGTAVLMLAVNISDSLVVADRLLIMENGALTQAIGGEEMERLNEKKELKL